MLVHILLHVVLHGLDMFLSTLFSTVQVQNSVPECFGWQETDAVEEAPHGRTSGKMVGNRVGIGMCVGVMRACVYVCV